MNKTNPKPVEPLAPVRPSARDPIAQWLDVFTRLLGLPGAERQSIRDELEDHLRNRVDDLMIFGMTENEAVQRAVAELGETADLAKRFKAARTSPHRRYLMTTAIAAAAGLAFVFGAFSFNSPSTPTSIAPQGIVAAQPEAEPDSAEHLRLDFDIPAGTLEEAFDLLGEAADVRMFVHWSSFEAWSIFADTEIPAIPAKGVEISKVKQFLDSVLDLDGQNMIAMQHEDGLVEIATQSFFDRRDAVTTYYDLSDLVPADNALEYTDEAAMIRQSIMETIEPEIWAGPSEVSQVSGPDGFCRIAITGTQLTIKAPERIQHQVVEFIERLKQAQKQRDRANEYQAQQEQEAMEAENKAELDRLARMKQQFTEELDGLTAELDSINLRYWEAMYTVDSLERRYKSVDEAESAQILTELIAARARTESIETERGVLKERFDMVFKRIQQVESQWIGRQF